MSASSLQRQAVREAAQHEAAVTAFDAELHRVARRLTTLLRRALEAWETDEQGRTVASVGNLARVFALRRQARDLVRRAGFDAAASAAVGDPLDRLAASVLRGQGMASMGPRLSQMLDAWRDLRLADLLGIADDVARTLQRVVLDGTLGLRPVDQLLRDVARALAVSVREARTVYDTAVSVYARQVDVSTSTGAGDEIFVYVGPVDEVMRPFCRAWVGKVRTRRAIARLDNGQLPDVMLTAGGYNCRHKWARVSVLDDELRALAGTRQRAPEILRLLEAA